MGLPAQTSSTGAAESVVSFFFFSFLVLVVLVYTLHKVAPRSLHQPSTTLRDDEFHQAIEPKRPGRRTRCASIRPHGQS